MHKYSLTVIPKPKEETRSIIELEAGNLGPCAVGVGSCNYHCSKCNHLILEKVEFGQFKDTVFRCNACGNYLET